jgi:predicted 3-demethylubiquinone-9 3-methyltransferase (glyoxalase superfamily)
MSQLQPRINPCMWFDGQAEAAAKLPEMLMDLHADPDRAKAGRVMEAMLKMKKIDIAQIQRAASVDVSSRA